MEQPLAFAPISLCEGDQGSGKSVTMVSEAVDLTFENVTSIKLAGGQEFKVSPALNEQGKPKVGWVTVHLKNKDIVAKCPVGSCVIADDVKIYANFHLFGIRALYLKASQILQYLNDGTIGYGYLYLDEHYIQGNAREGTSAVVKAFTKLSNQMRKRHIHLTYAVPHARQLDWIERSAVTKHIFCSYNEDTRRVTLNIRQKGRRGTRTLWFDAPIYFPYYLTDELFSLSEKQIGSAMASAR